jgi:TusE/DsrC/DsvC family sulfur relay protein
MHTQPPAFFSGYVEVAGKRIATDQEGYIQDMSEWSEEFAYKQAAREGLVLTDEHWDVIDFIRHYYEEHHVQPQVRAMIRHFALKWGPERGNNRYLHDLFPMGGPQKQGNRLAGIHRTRGEH